MAMVAPNAPIHVDIEKEKMSVPSTHQRHERDRLRKALAALFANEDVPLDILASVLAQLERAKKMQSIDRSSTNEALDKTSTHQKGDWKADIHFDPEASLKSILNSISGSDFSPDSSLTELISLSGSLAKDPKLVHTMYSSIEAEVVRKKREWGRLVRGRQHSGEGDICIGGSPASDNSALDPPGTSAADIPQPQSPRVVLVKKKSSDRAMDSASVTSASTQSETFEESENQNIGTFPVQIYRKEAVEDKVYSPPKPLDDNESDLHSVIGRSPRRSKRGSNTVRSSSRSRAGSQSPRKHGKKKVAGSRPHISSDCQSTRSRSRSRSQSPRRRVLKNPSSRPEDYSCGAAPGYRSRSRSTSRSVSQSPRKRVSKSTGPGGDETRSRSKSPRRRISKASSSRSEAFSYGSPKMSRKEHSRSQSSRSLLKGSDRKSVSPRKKKSQLRYEGVSGHDVELISTPRLRSDKRTQHNKSPRKQFPLKKESQSERYLSSLSSPNKTHSKNRRMSEVSSSTRRKLKAQKDLQSERDIAHYGYSRASPNKRPVLTRLHRSDRSLKDTSSRDGERLVKSSVPKKSRLLSSHLSHIASPPFASSDSRSSASSRGKQKAWENASRSSEATARVHNLSSFGFKFQGGESSSPRRMPLLDPMDDADDGSLLLDQNRPPKSPMRNPSKSKSRRSIRSEGSYASTQGSRAGSEASRRSPPSPRKSHSARKEQRRPDEQRQSNRTRSKPSDQASESSALHESQEEIVVFNPVVRTHKTGTAVQGLVSPVEETGDTSGKAVRRFSMPTATLSWYQAPPDSLTNTCHTPQPRSKSTFRAGEPNHDHGKSTTWDGPFFDF